MRHVSSCSTATWPGSPGLGVPDYRPRYSPVVRALVASGPLSIRDLAGAVGVTHSAASQTAAQMARHGLLTLETGTDARQRIARLTDRARALLPLIEAEWAATSAAAAELEAELPAALTDVLTRTERAVLSRPMRTRIADAARALATGPAPAGGDPSSAAGRRAALLAIAGGTTPRPGETPDAGSPAAGSRPGPGPSRLPAAVAGGLLSSFGGSMTSFAVVLQLWDLTRSSLAVGLLGLTFVPVLFVGLLGGAVADTVDRRKLALIVSGCLMAVSAAFAAQAYAGLGQAWLLYALAMVQAVLQATAAPSRRTFMPRLVPPEQLTAAIALDTLSGRMVMLAGPALAGLIAAAWGVRACYAIDAVSFVASLYATARLPPMRPAGRDARGAAGRPAGRGRPSLSATAAGLRFIGRRPLLVAAFLTDLDAMLLGLPVALFPALNAAHFGGSPRTLGLLNAAVGVGGLVSALLSGRPPGSPARAAACWPAR